jgi:hypothetical protein
LKSRQPKPRKFDNVVNIFGAEYYVPWDEVTVGASIFLPTTALPQQAKEELARAEQALGYRLAVRQRCEFGVLGLRVWRVY